MRNFVLPRASTALPWLPIQVDVSWFIMIYLGLLIAGLVIGLLGSMFAMRRYLKV